MEYQLVLINTVLYTSLSVSTRKRSHHNARSAISATEMNIHLKNTLLKSIPRVPSLFNAFDVLSLFPRKLNLIVIFVKWLVYFLISSLSFIFKTYICFECIPIRNMCTEVRLYNHRAKFHRGQNSGFKCNLCNLKFLTPRKLRKHKKMSHVFTKTYPCHFCDELFISETAVIFVLF